MILTRDRTSYLLRGHVHNSRISKQQSASASLDLSLNGLSAYSGVKKGYQTNLYGKGKNLQDDKSQGDSLT